MMRWIKANGVPIPTPGENPGAARIGSEVLSGEGPRISDHFRLFSGQTVVLDWVMRMFVRILLAVMVSCLLIGMAWAGGLYYWHYKVERIIRYVEDGGSEASLLPEMERTLRQAGCRALPNLLRATRSDRPAEFLNWTTSQIVETLNRDPVIVKENCDLRTLRRMEFRVETDDPESIRAAKVTRLHQWWGQHGSEVHQWWRFWTGNCQYPE
jgi:hypothetical protein